LPATVQYTFQAQPVTFDIGISFSDTTVITVVPAAIADFNQSTDINLISEVAESDFLRLFIDVTQGFCVTSGQQLPELFRAKCSFLP
jgi:hypothetical protein